MYNTAWNILQNTYISSPGGYGDNALWIIDYENGGGFRSYNSGGGSNYISYSLSLNTWYNIGLVNISNNNTDLYVNGSKIGTLNQNIQQIKKYFGRVSFFTSAESHLGKLDNIRIYDRILSANEIVKIYNFEKP